MGNTMRALDGQGRSVAISVDDNIAGVRRQLSAGVTIAGPLPLPVEVVPPEAQASTAWVDDQRPEIVGPLDIPWPADAVEYSVQVVEGSATLVGCPSGDVVMSEGTVRRGGLPEGAEESDTLTAWTSLSVPAGARVVLAFTRRP